MQGKLFQAKGKAGHVYQFRVKAQTIDWRYDHADRIADAPSEKFPTWLYVGTENALQRALYLMHSDLNRPSVSEKVRQLFELLIRGTLCGWTSELIKQVERFEVRHQTAGKVEKVTVCELVTSTKLPTK